MRGRKRRGSGGGVGACKKGSGRKRWEFAGG